MFTGQHKQMSALAGPVNRLLFVLSTYFAEAGEQPRQTNFGAEAQSVFTDNKWGARTPKTLTHIILLVTDARIV